MCFSKLGFLAFIAMVVNCTVEMDQKSQKIEVGLAAAEKSLGLCRFTAEELQGMLSGSDMSSPTVGLESN